MHRGMERECWRGKERAAKNPKTLEDQCGCFLI